MRVIGPSLIVYFTMLPVRDEAQSKGGEGGGEGGGRRGRRALIWLGIRIKEQKTVQSTGATQLSKGEKEREEGGGGGLSSNNAIKFVTGLTSLCNGEVLDVFG